jgi:hypothetical protein
MCDIEEALEDTIGDSETWRALGGRKSALISLPTTASGQNSKIRTDRVRPRDPVCTTQH